MKDHLMINRFNIEESARQEIEKRVEALRDNEAKIYELIQLAEKFDALLNLSVQAGFVHGVSTPDHNNISKIKESLERSLGLNYLNIKYYNEPNRRGF